MTRSWPAIFVLVLAAVGASVAIIVFRMGKTPELPVIATVPAFELTDEDGRPFTSKQLEGKVWVADAIFTRCPSVCPRMTDRLEDLEYKARGLDDVRFVSFSVDPEHDTPAALKQFGGEHSLPWNRWTLATGPRATISAVVTQALKLSFEPDGDNVTHDIHVVLVDRHLRVRGVYDSTDDRAMDRLAADLGMLATHR